MTGSLGNLMLAVACFVGGHFVLSSVNVRRTLVGGLGEIGFRAAYSLAALAALVWTVAAYGAAPYVELWAAGRGLMRVPAVLMPIACIFIVAGLTTRTVTMVGGERMAGEPDAVSGITTITRHPFLWGVALWGAGHIAASGDAANLILFGGMLVLALGGMAHIDHRRRVALGPDWGPIAMTTSAIPFLAAIQNRQRIDWGGIGWARPAGGVALYVALLFLHTWIAGVAVLPEFLQKSIG